MINPTLRPVRFYSGEEVAASEKISNKSLALAVFVESDSDLGEKGRETCDGKNQKKHLVESVREYRRGEVGRSLKRFQHLFFDEAYGPLESTTQLEHHIDTGDAAPISFPPFYVIPIERERIRKEVRKMKIANEVRDSNSP